MARPLLAYPSCRQPRLVTSGAGAVRVLADTDQAGHIAFFVSGHPKVRSVVAAAFQQRAVPLDPNHVIVKPAGEPDRSMIERGAEFLGSHPFARIVGIGGGSVMDWCRLSWATSAGLLSPDAGRIVRNGHNPHRPELWLVPTTCATGAEAASVAVFSNYGQKVPIVLHEFVADHAVLDGQFLGWATSHELARSLCDALSHVIEAYISIVPGTFAKHAAVSALQLILTHWPDAPSTHRHQRLMEAAYLGGVAASNCSVGVVHAFAHTMAAYGISHASGNAAGLLAGIEANAEAPALAELCRCCQLPDVEALTARLAPIVAHALEGLEAPAVRHVLQDCGRRQEIVERMSRDICLRSNPVPLDASGLHAFLGRIAGQLA